MTERGEVQCRAFSISVFFSREPFHTWRQKGLVRVLIQTGKKRDERLPDVPTLPELMDQFRTPDSSRRLAAVMLGSGQFGSWPMMSSPGIPEEQLKTLRAAFVKALNNADLLAEAKKKGIEIELISGEELESLAKAVIAQPPDVIALIRKLMGE